ncbi:MAG: polymerase subunit delta [Thermoleophilia bacterium]|jgi:DNA polymerase-3 subunit delta|nr:polymerase subunit delta [Thermoleophilia bacterium]
MALEPVYLVLGTDPAKIATVVQRLKAHFPPEAIESHPAGKDSSRDLIDSFGTLGLLAEQRLVIVAGAHDWPADDVSRVLTYLEQPSPDVVLLLLADKLASNSRLRKAFAKPRLIECPGPDKPEALRGWTESLFAATGASGDRAAIKRLIELCCGIDPNDARAVKELDGNDLARLRTDIERIAIYAGSDAVTVAMVDELATRVTDEKVWALGDAWARRDRTAFLRFVEQLLAQREHPVRLAGALGRHLRQVNDAHHLLQSMGPGLALDALVASGANAWAAKKVVQQAQQVKTAQVDAALCRIALLDAELKGANPLGGRVGEDTGAGARIVLERGLLELV